jgi:hypothetical protein
MVSSYLLDVVVRKSASILKLLAGEDQSLLVRGNSLLVLNLGLDIIDRIGGLDLKSDGLARKGLDEAVVQKLVPLPSKSLPFVAKCDRGFLYSHLH